MSNSRPHMRGDFPYRSIDDIRCANERAGYHFFDRDTLRFFRSRILDGVIHGRYFVTSEQFDASSPRLYTVREALPGGATPSVSEFQAFTSARQARRFAERIPADHSVYLAKLVVWAHEHAGGDWRQAARYAGLTDRQDRAELRRMFRKHAKEVR